MSKSSTVYSANSRTGGGKESEREEKEREPLFLLKETG